MALTQLECPACHHQQFVLVEDHNGDRWAQCKGCSVRHKLDEMNEAHGASEVCVMAPHVVSDTNSVQNALDGDLPDETTRQGYHRKISYILCECGERFNSRDEFDDHLTDV